MDIKEEEGFTSQLCNACLCVGRKLHKITDEKAQKFYLNAVDEIPRLQTISPNMSVCWECKALLHKTVAFRQQVQDAYWILQTFINENPQPWHWNSLVRSPRLSIHKADSINIAPSTEELNFEEVPLICVKDEVKSDMKSDDAEDDAIALDNDAPLSDTSDNSKQLDTELQTLITSLNKESKRKSGDKRKKAVKRTKKIGKNLKGDKKTKLKEENQKILTIELSYEELLLEREKESTRDSYVKAEYKCDTCLVGFNYKKSYLAHMSSKHSLALGDYICPICKTVISSVDSFTAHYKRHMRRYECSICQKRTLDMKVMQQHYYSTHEISLKEYKCNLCGKISNSIDTHRYHKDTHKARVQCTECDKTFRHRAGLMNHRLAVHEFHNAFPCTVCDKVFRWKTSLKRHFEKHEAKNVTNSGAAHCTMCNVSFSSICSYQRHMKNSLKHVTQHQLRFICDHCNKHFADKTKLRDHIEEKHLHRTYQCHICLKPSKNRVGLDQHIRNVHRRRPNNKICHHCGKGFPTKAQLESHIRTHTGERPFICEYCPTTFTQQSNLYKHNRQAHLNIKAKRYPIVKRKEDKIDVPLLENTQTVDPFKPVVLHYSGERGWMEEVM